MEFIINILAWIALMFALVRGLLEVYYLYIDYHNWKFINNNSLHNLQHIALILIFVWFDTILLWNIWLWIEVLVFNSILIFFALPHLEAERLDNL